MADAKMLTAEEQAIVANGQIPVPVDADPAETAEWMSSLDYILKSKGPERVKFLLKKLDTMARTRGCRRTARSQHALHQYDSNPQTATLSGQSRA